MKPARNNDQLHSYWMPFTPNKAFKSAPRLYERASGYHYYTTDGREILDGFSGLWCTNLGHSHPRIVEAITSQAAKLDYSTAFNFGHPQAFELANQVTEQFPGELNHAFFVNSGSEAADTALKMAIAYHRMRGEGSRTRLIGRELGYHGVGFGGISVGGMVNNRKFFGSLLPGSDHLSLPYNAKEQAFTRGIPTVDADGYMQELEKMIALHDPSTIAAVMVEPFHGSAGVFIPPLSYLKKLREITKRHGILLILDEVITGFGRLGTPNACQFFDVEPDLVTLAKAINNAAVPMGAVIAQKSIYDTFMDATPAGVELFHGYTYSGHPLAVAAALASQEVLRSEGVYDNVRSLAGYFEEAIHSLKGEPNVVDIRNIGLAGGLTLETRDGAVGARASDVFLKSFENGVALRNNGETIAVAPILTSSEDHIDQIVEALRKSLRSVD